MRNKKQSELILFKNVNGFEIMYLTVDERWRDDVFYRVKYINESHVYLFLYKSESVSESIYINSTISITCIIILYTFSFYKVYLL